jgi:NADPH:quinone reductase-like Zn-dependent oxidoreductase
VKAAVCTGYGPPEVLRITQVDKPTPEDNEVLIRIIATTLHVDDVRIRTLDMPRQQRLMARLAVGLRRPRHPILGWNWAA